MAESKDCLRTDGYSIIEEQALGEHETHFLALLGLSTQSFRMKVRCFMCKYTDAFCLVSSAHAQIGGCVAFLAGESKHENMLEGM